MILRDFQISPPALPTGDRRDVNLWLFPLYEAVRLDLKVRRPSAPFQKTVVSLTDERIHPSANVTKALSICEVFVPVEIPRLLSTSERLHVSIDAAVRGLKVVADSQGFDTSELVRRIERCSRSNPPCAHQFEGLARIHKASGVRCETWFTAGPGHSVVQMRFIAPNEQQHTVEVRAIDGPLYVEDDFPVRESRIRNERYELLGANREVLADVSIPSLRPPAG